MPVEQYQLFGPLRDEEFQALKADIAKRGVMVPVERDEFGNLLDGHHRARACRELGLPEPPSIIRVGLDEGGKVEHVLKLNLLRRHLGPVSWADGFRRLAEVRGVELGKRGPKPAGANSATVAELAQEVGVPVRTANHRLQTAEELAPHPDLAEKVDAGRMEIKRAQRVIRERAAEERRRQPLEQTTSRNGVETRLGDFRKILADLEPGSVDAIITDPPYPVKFWHLYQPLGELARRVLRVDGVLAVMTGTRLEMLDAVDQALGAYMRRRHRGVYLTPGPRWRDNLERVAIGYKPVLIYAHPDAKPDQLAWINDDVFASMGDDKNHHHWGQSESGFASIIDRLTTAGQLVLDPFLGGGTTAVVCRDLGRRFVGCDVDPAAVATARDRLA